MRKITALLLRMSAVIIALTNFGFSAGLTSTLRMVPNQDVSKYIHLLLGPRVVILVSLLVAFNADRIARFICRDDEDLSFGQVTGYEIAKIGVSLFALFILVTGISSFVYGTTNFILLDIFRPDSLKAQIRYITYAGACASFVLQMAFGGYLLLKTNRVATFISKSEPEPASE